MNPQQVTITPALKSQILNTHNQLRNKVALGQQSDFSTARKMAQIVWNDDLAYLAELNTKQCKIQLDACHNTAQFKYSGQNLGSLGTLSSVGHSDPSAVINSVINNWYSENSNALQGDIDKLTKIYNQKFVIAVVEVSFLFKLIYLF